MIIIIIIITIIKKIKNNNNNNNKNNNNNDNNNNNNNNNNDNNNNNNNNNNNRINWIHVQRGIVLSHGVKDPSRDGVSIKILVWRHLKPTPHFMSELCLLNGQKLTT